MVKILQAFLFAKKAHKGQVDKAGKSYIWHPINVAFRVNGYSTKVVALLHDVIEDTSYSISDISFLNDEEKIALSLLTRDDSVDYFDYIKSLKNNSIAKGVKISDLNQNMNMKRLKKITEKDLKRLEKYKRAKEILLN